MCRVQRMSTELISVRTSSTSSVSEAMAWQFQKVRFRRDTLLQIFERAAPAIVGIESCAGSQWIARKIKALGHRLRSIPALFVKPYVKSNKTDIIDAEAIAEAATRPTMRFAALKSEEQADLQALHRVRDQMIGTRTRRINQIAFCLEYGITLRQGAGLFKLDLPQVLEDKSNDLSSAMRKLEQRIGDVTREIEAIASREDVARRLMTIPFIGALGATAILAAIGNGRQFQKARDLAAKSWSFGFSFRTLIISIPPVRPTFRRNRLVSGRGSGVWRC